MESETIIILNFSHPLTAIHLEQVGGLTLQEVDRVIDLKTHFDQEQPFVPQVSALVDSVGISSEEWQTTRLLVNPPSLSAIAVTVLAELHGRMGYFPAILRLKPIPNITPPQFEVAEIVNLQTVREEARIRR